MSATMLIWARCLCAFGIHLTQDEFDGVKDRIAEAGLKYIDEPYRRFKGDKYEQETFFIDDPNGNILEIKTMKNPEVLWPAE